MDAGDFAVSNGNVEDPLVLERPIRGFDFSRSDADDHNPVSLRHEFGGLRVLRFHLFGRLLEHSRQLRVPAVRACQRPAFARNDPLDIFGSQRQQIVLVVATHCCKEILHKLDMLFGAHRISPFSVANQMAEKPPSTDNSTPFTKLESSEARNSAAAAISSGRPIFPRGIRDSNICFASSVRTWSCIGVAIGPGCSTFTRIFLPLSSLSHPRANACGAALLAAYTLYPGKPLLEATAPVMKLDPPSLNSGNAFWTVN